MMDVTSGGNQDRVGIVLAGAGARGAYEAGVLSVLLPAMEEHGQRPTVILGTSAGAINAALLASLAHLPAKDAVQVMLDKWRQARRANVYRPLLPGGMLTGARYMAEFLGFRANLSALLDTSPLHSTITGWLDWQQLHDNTHGKNPPVEAVGVVATAFRTCHSVVFVEGPLAAQLPAPDVERGLDYVRTSLNTDHIMASAAIPVAFPSVWVEGESNGGDWYMDGGVRMNTPLKPALSLGVDKLAVVATAPLIRPPESASSGKVRRPDVFDASEEILQAALVDRMVEDVRHLAQLNELLPGRTSRATSARPAGATGRGKKRIVPYLFAGPTRTGLLSELATDVFRERVGGGPWSPRQINVRLLDRLLGGNAASRGELLSYLFFEPAFMAGAIELGEIDGWRLLDGSSEGLPWRTDAP